MNVSSLHQYSSDLLKNQIEEVIGEVKRKEKHREERVMDEGAHPAAHL